MAREQRLSGVRWRMGICSRVSVLPPDSPGTHRNSDADHVERHNLLVQYMIELMSAAKSSGAAIAVENPVPRGNPESPFYQTGLSDHSSLWDLPEMVKMMSSFYMISVDFPQCALHADFQKYTRVAFTPTLRPWVQFPGRT